MRVFVAGGSGAIGFREASDMEARSIANTRSDLGERELAPDERRDS